MNSTPISALLERKGSSVHAVPSTVTIAQAVDEMNRHRIGSIVVLENQRAVGIFTERDVLRRVVGQNIDPRVKRVADVMTANLITISPETTIEETMILFADKRCRHLPVLSNDRLVGLISIGDISRWMADAHRTEAEHLKNYIAGGLSA
jgi:Predicted signal-transduction protein containing cAMP-binding and CBS domains